CFFIDLSSTTPAHNTSQSARIRAANCSRKRPLQSRDLLSRSPCPDVRVAIYYPAFWAIPHRSRESGLGICSLQGMRFTDLRSGRVLNVGECSSWPERVLDTQPCASGPFVPRLISLCFWRLARRF